VTTQAAVSSAYGRLAVATADSSRITLAAQLILAVFDDFYRHLCEYPYRAKRAFEQMDPHASVRISRERLGLYSRYIAEHGPKLAERFPQLRADSALWEALDRLFVAMIVDRYEADTAFSFAHSMRRNICHELWKPVAYSFPPPNRLRALSMASAHRRLPVPQLDAQLIREALQIPGFEVPFKDIARDARLICQRLETVLPQGRPRSLDVIEAGFFRDRYAFVVGRFVYPGEHVVPFVVALRNSPQGIYADAVLHRVGDVHELFSSTLANLHVTTVLYYQTCVFLHSLMPRRPLGEHYSTIGFNHVGKVAILNEISAQIEQGRCFSPSPGAPGTVALGFTFDQCAYHLKVIRDRPTQSYKWGSFPGIAAVEEKYRLVHEIDRAGSMLDNVMYFNLRLDTHMFEPGLLAELSRQASNTVRVTEEGVFLRCLIAQLKIVPLPVYLELASEADIRAAMVSLGNCIRNNAATNIFNKDLDSRNYGVGRYGRVFLFDYDAVEQLTEVKIRTNADREPGEDEAPAWFFEEGTIFLPEELEYGMQFKNDFARRCFREENPDLLGVEYWLSVQHKLLHGEVPPLSMYPDSCRLSTAYAE
jgi:isocitrate dehydrogenase kinase/phosphatase